MGEREGISGKFAVSISFLTDHFCSFDCVAVRWRYNHTQQQPKLFVLLLLHKYRMGGYMSMARETNDASIWTRKCPLCGQFQCKAWGLFYISQDFHKRAATQKCVSKIGWADTVTKNCHHQCGSELKTLLKGPLEYLNDLQLTPSSRLCPRRGGKLRNSWKQKSPLR